VRFLSCRSSDDRHLLEFRADHPGTAHIRVYRILGHPQKPVPAFTLLVDVYEPVRPSLRRGYRGCLRIRATHPFRRRSRSIARTSYRNCLPGPRARR
jgi:hypothetical protein